MEILVALSSAIILIFLSWLGFYTRVYSHALYGLVYGTAAGLLAGITWFDWLPAATDFADLLTVAGGVGGGAVVLLLITAVVRLNMGRRTKERWSASSVSLILTLFIFNFTVGLYLSEYLVPADLISLVVKTLMASLLLGFILGLVLADRLAGPGKLILFGLICGILGTVGATLTIIIPLIPGTVFSLIISGSIGAVWFTILTSLIPVGLKYRRLSALASALAAFTLVMFLY